MSFYRTINQALILDLDAREPHFGVGNIKVPGHTLSIMTMYQGLDRKKPIFGAITYNTSMDYIRQLHELMEDIQTHGLKEYITSQGREEFLFSRYETELAQNLKRTRPHMLIFPADSVLTITDGTAFEPVTPNSRRIILDHIL